MELNVLFTINQLVKCDLYSASLHVVQAPIKTLLEPQIILCVTSTQHQCYKQTYTFQF